MRETKFIMGMPITVEIVADMAENTSAKSIAGYTESMREVFDYFIYVDEKFSTYKSTSEINAINAGILAVADYSDDMKEIFMLSERTKKETEGYFDIVNREGKYDPSGLVKGWAIFNASKILQKNGFGNFFIDAGGDVQTSGKNARSTSWTVGIADPFKGNYSAEAATPMVKVLHVSGQGVATSGTSVRGQHIYNPHKKSAGVSVETGIHDIVSLTVIGPDIYEADRFATAAFAMGKKGIEFIEKREGLEGYMIDKDGMAVMTSGFEKFT